MREREWDEGALRSIIPRLFYRGDEYFRETLVDGGRVYQSLVIVTASSSHHYSVRVRRDKRRPDPMYRMNNRLLWHSFHSDNWLQSYMYTHTHIPPPLSSNNSIQDQLPFLRTQPQDLWIVPSVHLIWFSHHAPFFLYLGLEFISNRPVWENRQAINMYEEQGAIHKFGRGYDTALLLPAWVWKHLKVLY